MSVQHKEYMLYITFVQQCRNLIKIAVWSVYIVIMLLLQSDKGGGGGLRGDPTTTRSTLKENLI
jgi:hypothetical protein